jgi:hypothetical protein
MLQSITLSFTELAKPIIVPTQGVTLFVGPNNSGKSLALKEIEASISTNGPIHTHIVKNFEFLWPNAEQFRQDLQNLTDPPQPGDTTEVIRLRRLTPDGFSESQATHKSFLFSRFESKEKHEMGSHFFRLFQIKLDGRTRFALTDDRPQGDLLGSPNNILARLFQDDEKRRSVRDIIHDAFGSYFVLDPTVGGSLRIRLSETPPLDDEQSLNKAARDFHARATYIKQASDGVQAFVGITCSVVADDYKLILIDEPEAFLHPPLARKLGYQLSKLGSKRAGSLIASTHSSDFLMGCLQANPNVNIVRVEYSNGKSKGRFVDGDSLSAFFRSPLMRSTNVISGLFHDGVVVTESDNDRVFYSEIYHRLSEAHPGFPSLLFVNAQNKQTIKEIIGPLRSFGVPAIGISDIDILKDGGTTWTGWLTAANIPVVQHNSLGVARGDILKKYRDAAIDMKADGGVDALPNIQDREATNDLFDTLANYGVFVTRRGELEHWLCELRVPGKKTDWTVSMLKRLGSDPSSPDYVKVGDSDVWDFMMHIVTWIRDPARKGM